MIEIHYLITGNIVRLWQPGWTQDTFELMQLADFNIFKTLAYPFSIKFVESWE